jgi:hypothetical protein
VATALAIGKYGADHAKLLESVFIDEGFSSLDAAGLRAMPEERHQPLQTLVAAADHSGLAPGEWSRFGTGGAGLGSVR